MSKIYTILMQGVLNIEADDNVSTDDLIKLAKQSLVIDDHYDLEFVVDAVEDIEEFLGN